MASIRKGYECEFTSDPPVNLQLLCPICRLVLREPHETTCCQSNFCRVCIERIEANNNPCPSCKRRVFNKSPNIRLQRALNGLEVTCTYKSQGCRWVGLLGNLESHFNLNPEPACQPVGCHFAPVSCLYCHAPIQRYNVQVHQREKCEERPTRCEFCNLESTFADITKRHDCKQYPTLCHKCNQVFLRQDFQDHVDNYCPMTPIDCDFKHVGCKIALPRKDMSAHLRENVVAHVSLQAAGHEKMEKENKKLRKTVTEQQQEIVKLTKEVKALRSSLSMFQSMIQPVQLTMSHFAQYKRKDDDWISTPFYTHPQGYKMCLRVHANGILASKETHVSVYVHLMKGEFDDHLEWPFRGVIAVQLLGVHTHHTKNVIFNASTPDEYAVRVTKEGRANQGWGYSDFIPHTEVTEFIRNDCLHFRISIM